MGEREIFENSIQELKLATTHYKFERNDFYPDEYRDLEMQAYWRLWQARAALDMSDEMASAIFNVSEWLTKCGYHGVSKNLIDVLAKYQSLKEQSK